MDKEKNLATEVENVSWEIPGSQVQARATAKDLLGGLNCGSALPH